MSELIFIHIVEKHRIVGGCIIYLDGLEEVMPKVNYLFRIKNNTNPKNKKACVVFTATQASSTGQLFAISREMAIRNGLTVTD
ncbi:hypothetical protein [Larkinella sp.]|uniref:hypothetical protein n=1 Tax=Larkinella sp. TaxID=2034517 RepID=UPI003BAB9EDF